jgi:hypothetical protein
MKRAIYKVRVEIPNDGKVRVTSYTNRLIPFDVFRALNEAVHEAREKLNNEAPWKKSYIRFEHEGKVYEQVDQETGKICDGCVFCKTFEGRVLGCQHPYYLDGTKGRCDGKIFVEQK